MGAASATPLFQLNGSYFLRAFDTVHNLDNGTVQLTGATSYSIPDTIYSLSDTFFSPLTAYAEIFGSMGIDGGHCCFEKVDNTIRTVYSQDIGSAYSAADFSAFDTVTPTSSTLAVGTPVVFTFTGWAEGSFSSAGTCPAGCSNLDQAGRRPVRRKLREFVGGAEAFRIRHGRGLIFGRVDSEVVGFVFDCKAFHRRSPCAASAAAAAITFITPVGNTSKRILEEIDSGQEMARSGI